MIKFSSQHHEENRYKDEDLIKLKPYGISLTTDPQRPTLLLRDETGTHVLPVNLSPLEAGVTLAQSAKTQAPVTPHRVTEWLLDTLQIQISRCVFVEIKGAQQYVRLHFENHPSHGSLKLRADEVMSLVLHLNVEIFATQELMRKSKLLSAEIETLEQALKVSPSLLARPHEYIQ